jgi:hypothetical protein
VLAGSTEIAVYRDLGGPASRQSLTGVAGIVAAAFDSAGRLFLAARDAVLAVDPASGAVTRIPCGCAPAALVPMNTAFRLNELGSGPLWLLDVAGEPRTVFVPAR